jgi:hypothetical protein
MGVSRALAGARATAAALRHHSWRLPAQPALCARPHHLAGQLLDGNTPDHNTLYPIASKSEQQFESMAKRRIPGLSDRHKAMVKQTQPYHRGDEAANHPLAMLADFSNADKHQVVHTAFSIVGYDASKTLDALIAGAKQEQSPVQGWWLASEGKLEHGTPWFRIVFERGSPPPKEVKIAGDIMTEVAFGEIGMPVSEFPKLAEGVRPIMEAFLAEFPETHYTDG